MRTLNTKYPANHAAVFTKSGGKMLSILLRFRHLALLLFWPAFSMSFYILENVYRPERWHVVHCALDDAIPFCEWFIIPYLFWFLYLIAMHIYTGIKDPPAFRRMMRFIIFCYGIAVLLYFLVPTAQHLRPRIFPRDNILTRWVASFYSIDTNTNVCPSLHVVGAMAVLFAAWDTPQFRTRGWRAAFAVSSTLICLSTVFLKQHSVIDVAAGLLLSMIGYYVVYRRRVILPLKLRRVPAS